MTLKCYLKRPSRKKLKVALFDILKAEDSYAEFDDITSKLKNYNIIRKIRLSVFSVFSQQNCLEYSHFSLFPLFLFILLYLIFNSNFL